MQSDRRTPKQFPISVQTVGSMTILYVVMIQKAISYLIQYKLKYCMIIVSEDTAMPNLIRNLRLVSELTNIQIRPRWGKREHSIYDPQEFTFAVLIFSAVLLTGTLFRICSRYEIHSARPICFLYSNSRRTRHSINNHTGNRLHCGNPMMHHTYHHD